MKKAFTLAEILISMTIIGVISLLMIPVMQNTQLKSLETATAHFYSMMTQAIKQYMNDNDTETLSSTPMFLDGLSEDYETESQRAYKEVDNFVYKYLKVKKMCEYTNRTDCFNKKIFNLNGDSGDFILQGESANMKIYVLDNGSTFMIRPPDSWWPAVLQVDINGKKGPNIAGRDIWAMNIYADGVLSEKLHYYQHSNHGKLNEEIERQKKETMKWQFEICYSDDINGNPHWRYGSGCFARFEYNGFKFDY